MESASRRRSMRFAFGGAGEPAIGDSAEWYATGSRSWYPLVEMESASRRRSMRFAFGGAHPAAIISTISAPMASDAVAAGLGAFSTCKALGRAIDRKSVG